MDVLATLLGSLAGAPKHHERLLRLHRAAVLLMWVLLGAAAVAFTVWAITAQPWVEPPSETTPPLTGW